MKFEGFPNRVKYLGVPAPMFGPVLEKIDNLIELKVILRVIWYTQNKETTLITFDELLADRILYNSIKALKSDMPNHEVLTHALDLCIKTGTLLKIIDPSTKSPAYQLNTETNRRNTDQYKKISFKVELTPWETEDSEINIYTLYEQNISTLTPIIAEKLKEAQENYPYTWIAEAFTESINNNKRNWSYISTILNRWETEGKNNGKPSRNIKKTKRI
jgi:DnaD/phage-associated family protein